ncbi:MAG: enoyl-CoA hydratase [Flavobacteriales bacterium]|nr:enoyl-CoA hydratase [Flavobacteriales bacterium]
MEQAWESLNNFKNQQTICYKYDLDLKVGIIKIQRPKHLNALNKYVILDLEYILDHMEKDTSIRSIIITGEGEKAFVAGADIKEFQKFDDNEAYTLSKLGKEKVFNKIEQLNKPVIAAINGYALGGGLELALSCHIRVASENAQLGLPECTIGLLPGYGGTQRLPKIIGMGHAMEMILTGKMIDSFEAHRIGLVNYNVPSEKLLTKCLEIAKSFIKTSPDSLLLAINSINNSFFNKGDKIESQNFAKLFKTQNFKEGVAAFLEKRKANYKASSINNSQRREQNK